MSETNSSKKSPRENASASSLEDNDLVKKAKTDDEQAYKRLVKKYERPLYFHIKKMVREEERVEDLVQESFVKAFDSLKSYNIKYAFSTWLYRIATNHTIDYLRKKKLKTLSIDEPAKTREGKMEIQLPDQSVQTDQHIIRSERKKMVQNAIDGLPEKYRRVIILRHMEEKSYKEISKILDQPLGTVKAHIFRARELLYKAMKDKRKRF